MPRGTEVALSIFVACRKCSKGSAGQRKGLGRAGAWHGKAGQRETGPWQGETGQRRAAQGLSTAGAGEGKAEQGSGEGKGSAGAGQGKASQNRGWWVSVRFSARQGRAG